MGRSGSSFIRELGDEANGDPPDDNGDHAEADFLDNRDGRWREVDGVTDVEGLQSDRMADGNVRPSEVHSNRGQLVLY